MSLGAPPLRLGAFLSWEYELRGFIHQLFFYWKVWILSLLPCCMHHWFINSFVTAVRPVWTHSAVSPSRLIEGLHLLCTHVKHRPWERRRRDLGFPAPLISPSHHGRPPPPPSICHLPWHHCAAAPAKLPISMFTSPNRTSDLDSRFEKKNVKDELSNGHTWYSAFSHMHTVLKLPQELPN